MIITTDDISRVPGESYSFFAVQVAISSYPKDPIRTYFHDSEQILNEISDFSEQCKLLKIVLSRLSESLRFMDYCVWDYSMISSVAKKEFESWEKGLTDAIEDEESGDTQDFSEKETSYFTVTFSILSTHPSLTSWLEYYPDAVMGDEMFKKSTLELLIRQYAKPDSHVMAKSRKMLFSVMPKKTDKFYTGTILTNDDWKYLKPMY